MCCKKYKDLRHKYLPETLYNRPSMYKFINLLNSKNVTVLRKLGLFLFNVYKIYEDSELFSI